MRIIRLTLGAFLPAIAVGVISDRLGLHYFDWMISILVLHGILFLDPVYRASDSIWETIWHSRQDKIAFVVSLTAFDVFVMLPERINVPLLLHISCWIMGATSFIVLMWVLSTPAVRKDLGFRKRNT